MADNMRRINSLLFDNKTTSRTDYCDGEIRPIIKTVYQEHPMPVRAPLKPLKCNQTLSVLNGEVPFNLYHRSKEIVRQDPRKVQKVYGQVLDSKELLLSIQKSRPRVYMTPAICLDNVEEPTRELFIKEVYKSSTVQAMEAVVARLCPHNVKAPLSPVYAPPSPIKLKPLVMPYVSPEWRMKSVSFDNQQLRSYTDPTKEFWLARTPKCNVCDETAAREARQKMRQR